jgi:hypothetical protein
MLIETEKMLEATDRWPAAHVVVPKNVGAWLADTAGYALSDDETLQLMFNPDAGMYELGSIVPLSSHDGI